MNSSFPIFAVPIALGLIALARMLAAPKSRGVNPFKPRTPLQKHQVRQLFGML